MRNQNDQYTHNQKYKKNVFPVDLNFYLLITNVETTQIEIVTNELYIIYWNVSFLRFNESNVHTHD